VYTAKPGTALVVNRNNSSAAQDDVQGLLALEHHNATGKRADVIGLQGGLLP